MIKIDVLKDHYQRDGKFYDRLVIGNLMPAYNSCINVTSEEHVGISPAPFVVGGSQTGEIGFMDFRVETDAQQNKKLRVYGLGVEPEYHEGGYFRDALQGLEEKAESFGCNEIFVESIKDDELFKMLRAQGYTRVQTLTRNAVKNLHQACPA